MTRLAVAAAGLVLATLLGLAIDADVATAALTLLVSVVAASLLGRVPGLVAALLGALILNVRFTPPVGSLRVETTDDIVAIVTFLVVAVVVGSVVGVSTELRNEAGRRAGETALRLDVTARLVAGEPPRVVLDAAVHSLVELFDLARCSITAADERAEAISGAREGATVSIERDSLTLHAAVRKGRPSLAPEDVAVFEGLIAGLSTALERLSFQEQASEALLAAAVSRTRAGFLSAVSHNLRTPLTAIRTAVDTLLATDIVLADDDRVDMLHSVRDDTARLERLVGKVLDLGRIRAGGFVPEPESVDLPGVIQAIAHRVRLVRPDVRMRVDVGPDVRVVCLDLTMIEQVLLNLLENAAQHSPRDAEISVVARKHRQVLVLRVIDHGPGVDIAARSRIFEPFERGDRSTAGTGLGLAIVSAVVEVQGGGVSVDDTPDGGATFTVEIPLPPLSAPKAQA